MRLSGNVWITLKNNAPADLIVHPVACLKGRWIHSDGRSRWVHRNPSDWDTVLGEVASASEQETCAAVVAAAEAQAVWREIPQPTRAEYLLSWERRLGEWAEPIALGVAREIGKPISEARAEVSRARETLRVTAQTHGIDRTERVSSKATVRQRPLGVVAAITPWNNPVAIPIGKMAPALIYGNALVWKPAIQAPLSSRLLMQTLLASDIPPGLVNMLFGDAQTARALISHPGIAAVSLTGSNRTGRRTAALCGKLLKPLQAELGGNNAVIVMPDGESEMIARELAESAFSFAGQRCTSNRRIIVIKDILPRFEAAMVAAIESLVVGDPLLAETQVGPVISRSKQRQIGRIVAKARSDGAELLTGGRVPKAGRGGCWYQPTLFKTMTPDIKLVQEESFGPLAIIQPARDIEEAMDLCNGVPQGLMASLYSHDQAIIRRFLANAQAGNIKLNLPTVGIELKASFTGWKCSGLGPGEHGRSDREFYSQSQALYGVHTD